MHVSVTFRQMEATPALKDFATDKVQKIVKFINKPTDAHVVLSLEKYMHKADISISTNGVQIRGAEKSEDMYASIDRAIEKIERQLKRYREKLKRHQPRASDAPFRVRFNVIEGLAGDEETPSDATPPRVVKTNEYLTSPMTLDEAVMQMDLLDSDLLVFQNVITNQINVIYRRKDETYGLIEASTDAGQDAAPSA